MANERPGGRPFHLAMYSGIVVRADAISGSVRSKLDVIRDLERAGFPLRVTVFTHASDTPEPEIVCVGSAGDLVTCPPFRDADAHLFEFGIRYDLFDAVFLIPPGQPIAAVYHNITPAALVDPEQRPAIERSLIQKHNLSRVDRVSCVSEFDRDDLLAFGIPAERLTVLHLPPAVTAPAAAVPAGEIVEFLYVGRLVPAKGVLDLARAVADMRRHGVDGFRVTLAGNEVFSSQDCMAEVRRLIADHSLEAFLRVVPSPDDRQLGVLYAESDALVLPSYHEGYCLPVIEALSAGCYVIGYDTTNLPNVIGGLGTLVAPGDVAGLSAAMAGLISEVARAGHDRDALRLPLGPGAMPMASWRRAVAEHLRGYSLDAFRRGFVELLGWMAARSPRGGELAGALGVAAAPPVGASLP